jgi:hypothetical protein
VFHMQWLATQGGTYVETGHCSTNTVFGARGPHLVGKIGCASLGVRGRLNRGFLPAILGIPQTSSRANPQCSEMTSAGGPPFRPGQKHEQTHSQTSHCPSSTPSHILHSCSPPRFGKVRRPCPPLSAKIIELRICLSTLVRCTAYAIAAQYVCLGSVVSHMFRLACADACETLTRKPACCSAGSRTPCVSASVRPIIACTNPDFCLEA